MVEKLLLTPEDSSAPCYPSCAEDKPSDKYFSCLQEQQVLDTPNTAL